MIATAVILPSLLDFKDALDESLAQGFRLSEEEYVPYPTPYVRRESYAIFQNTEEVAELFLLV